MTALAERPVLADTQLLDERGIWFSGLPRDEVTIEAAEPTAGLAYSMTVGPGYPETAPQMLIQGRVGSSWVRLGEPQARVVVLMQPIDLVEIGSPNENDFTYSVFAPMFKAPVGTGELISEIRDSVYEAWHHYIKAAAAPVMIEPSTPLLLDIPGALQEARSQAGLPVQDIAAMVGIKRRQFYNLISGEDTPEPERERRIARVTNAISQVSGLVGGNSRKVRAVLLARLEGDSIYDAAVADDDERLAGATERACAAATEELTGTRRLAPSDRATSAEAAAVREFLRATRDDDTGATRD